MKSTVTSTDGCAIVAFEGEIDFGTSPQARQVLMAEVTKSNRIIVDLSGCSYMDSSGIASLVEAFQEVRSNGGGFGLAAIQPKVDRVLRLAHLERVFRIFATVDEALAEV